MLVVGTEAKGGDGEEWWWDVVDAAPHLYGGRGAVDFTVGVFVGVAVEDEGVYRVRGEWGKGSG